MRPKGGARIGQTPPQSEPVLFAVDIVSSNRFEHGTVTFSPDGTEAFWGSSYFLGESGYTYGRLLTTRVEDGRWTAPRMAEFSGVRLGDGEPFFSPDGKRLYFLSRRALEEGGPAGELGIWFVDRTSTGWSEPRRLEGGPNAIGLYWQFSVAQNGNIYFGSSVPGGLGRSDIYVSRFAGGEYLEAENLGPVVNGEWSDGSPFVAPDESYLIITRGEHPDNLGDSDLWISFRDAGGSWTTPVNLPAPINSESREICPQVTGDGKYLLFNSFRNGQADNYWVDAGIIARLRSRRSQ
jgi:Tol biopolymer transport system component